MSIQEDVAARYFAGRNLLAEGGTAADQGLSLIAEAAHAGHADAAHFICLVTAADRTRSDNWQLSLAYLCRAAKAGHALAQETLVFLANPHEISAATADAPEFSDDRVRRLHDTVDLDAWRAAPPAEPVRESPGMSVITGLAPPKVCDWIIRRAEPKLDRAMVYHPQGGGSVGTRRTNRSMGFEFSERDLIMLLLSDRIAAVSGYFLEEFEPATVLHYSVGQEFLPHFDYFDPAVPAYAAEMKANGQRRTTLLLYLNDEFEGGETDFPRLGFRYKGRKGDALLFQNVLPTGVPDPRTLHAGLAPARGQKWLYSQWLRRKA
jgi:hypothetical protein